MAEIIIVEPSGEIADELVAAFEGTDIRIVCGTLDEVKAEAFAIASTVSGELLFEMPERAFEPNLRLAMRQEFDRSGPLAVGEFRGFVTGDTGGFATIVVVPMLEFADARLLGSGSVLEAMRAVFRCGDALGLSSLAVRFPFLPQPGLPAAFVIQQARQAYALEREQRIDGQE
jgi:hypothetical protein